MNNFIITWSQVIVLIAVVLSSISIGISINTYKMQKAVAEKGIYLDKNIICAEIIQENNND